MAHQYRYSSQAFSRSVITALGLTLIVTFLIWLFARLFGLRHANEITIISGLIFFGFCSATMVWRYLRREVVLALRPDGLFDARYSSQVVPWDDIKDVRLGRAENEFSIGVYLWPKTRVPVPSMADGQPTFTIDLSSLDAPVERILQQLAGYKQISLEQ